MQAHWTHSGIDVLSIESGVRSFVFSSRGSIVVESVAGELFADAPVPRGRVLVNRAGAPPLRFRAGGAFRVMFDDAPPPSSAATFRAYAPCVVGAAGANPGAVFASAMRALSAVPRSGSPLPPPIARAWAYVEAHLAEDFDLETLSGAAGIGRFHLCRSFSRLFGLPPYRFRTQLRVARARELLAAGQGCSDVAYAAGFCDQSHFTRAFKELTGTTPGAYARVAARLAMAA